MIQPSEGQVIASRYRLERLIARGGMGSVWAAWHMALDAPVAVKFMEASLAVSGEARGRFEREAKAAAQLRTPHVVHIHDHGVDGDTPYIVMELLKGEDLGARLRRVKRLGLPEASRLAMQAARALRVAHGAGIVHRDLKPGNVYLARTDDDEEETVKLLDFGIAKSTLPDLDESTKTGQLLGSPDYMSPEQSRATKRVDARSDLWSLGVILYRAITGKKPFVGEGVGDLIVKICTEQTAPPSSLVASLPRTIDAFFEKALAKSPADRFQTARELADAFAIAAGVADPASDSSRASIVEPTPSAMRIEAATAAGIELATGGGSGTLTSTSSAAQPRRIPHSAMLLGLGAGVFALVVALGTVVVLLGRDRQREAGPASAAAGSEHTASATSAPTVEARPAPTPSEPPVMVEPSPVAAAGSSTPDAAKPATPKTVVTAAATARPRPMTPPQATPPATASAKPKKKPDFGY